MDSISIRQARRLALARAGLLPRRWSGLPGRGRGRGRSAALEVIDRFGYLQLDTVSIAGARSHALVPMSRIENFDAALGEELLRPGEPLFEFWGHEVSWIPLDLWPVFAFRRRRFRDAHPWWGDLVGEHPQVADRLLGRIRDEGPLRSADMEGASGKGWWDLKLAKRVATALWSSGVLAIRERRAFQRSYDLTERVIPDEIRESETPEDDAIATLLLRALDGHGWATTGTLASTWRLRNRGPQLRSILRRLESEGSIVACTLEDDGGGRTGWIRPRDLELAHGLDRIRPRSDTGVLLSPFDPVLWDRARVESLFGFEQILEIFKPAAQRKYGYFCLPILAGETLIGRVDLKADRDRGRLRVLSLLFESTGTDRPAHTEEARAARTALERHARQVKLRLDDIPSDIASA